MINIKDLNHVALAVSDVPRSVRFYGETIGLKQKERPAFDFDGAWFQLGETRELHLLEGLDHSIQEHPRGDHFAIEIEDFEACQQHLEAVGANIININLRPDGARQIFITDPDDHVVEFCVLPCGDTDV